VLSTKWENRATELPDTDALAERKA
jgi:Lrp/AsnC family leucine-responsive transcriptional regulator